MDVVVTGMDRNIVCFVEEFGSGRIGIAERASRHLCNRLKSH